MKHCSLQQVQEYRSKELYKPCIWIEDDFDQVKQNHRQTRIQKSVLKFKEQIGLGLEHIISNKERQCFPNLTIDVAKIPVHNECFTPDVPLELILYQNQNSADECEKQRTQIEISVYQYLKSIGLEFETDPTMKKNLYFTEKRANSLLQFASRNLQNTILQRRKVGKNIDSMDGSLYQLQNQPLKKIKLDLQ